MSTEQDTFEFSEFSIYEILYMGHEGLTFLVENMAAATLDPFDVLAAIEERLGKPIATLFKETPM